MVYELVLHLYDEGRLMKGALEEQDLERLDKLHGDMLQLLGTVRNLVSFGAHAKAWIKE